MKSMFDDFDFEILDDPEFREDSVREELVVPLLRELGYSASPPHKIIRSKRLEHPFAYIGSIPKKICIIPDYLLQRDEQNAWIMDAKGPSEDIESGKNVEQAYSYAIHKDIRVPLYALCNGRNLAVYHISHWPAIFNVPLSVIDHHWGDLLALLGTRAAWPGGIPPGFRPDFGLAVKQSGLGFVEGKKTMQIFTSVHVITIVKIDESTFAINAVCGTPEEGEFMATFDFTPGIFQQLLSVLSVSSADCIRTSIQQQPFIYRVEEGHIFDIGVVAELGDTVHSNENESYCPFVAHEFIGPETVA